MESESTLWDEYHKYASLRADQFPNVTRCEVEFDFEGEDGKHRVLGFNWYMTKAEMQPRQGEWAWQMYCRRVTEAFQQQVKDNHIRGFWNRTVVDWVVPRIVVIQKLFVRAHKPVIEHLGNGEFKTHIHDEGRGCAYLPRHPIDVVFAS